MEEMQVSREPKEEGAGHFAGWVNQYGIVTVMGSLPKMALNLTHSLDRHILAGNM